MSEKEIAAEGIKKIERKRRIAKAAVFTGDLAVASAGIALRAYGVPYQAIRDIATNVSLGYVGAAILKTLYKKLKVFDGGEAEGLTIATVGGVSAAKETVDASAKLKSMLPQYLKGFFNKWDAADPIDFLGNVGGAGLYLAVDRLIDRHYDKLRSKYEEVNK
jgi:hypothetical protein